jgi:hypothetical protein
MKSSLYSVTRVKAAQQVMSLDEVLAADRRYFEEHPDAEEYIREFCPGEFGAMELPEIPDGFRYATCVSRLWRDGKPVGRYRELMAICERVPESKSPYPACTAASPGWRSALDP